MIQVPHPIPYQGSKRKLAPLILSLAPKQWRTLYEPFAGSAATTIAAALSGRCERFVIGDSLSPLIGIWNEILANPEMFANRYEEIWRGQEPRPDEHYLRVREEFNRTQEPAQLLYLLARCVKNAVRFNAYGQFNQSADHRRKGMNPDKMRKQILGAHKVLANRAEARCTDYTELVSTATSRDLVYMDPPYQGVSGSRDPRYHQQLRLETLIVTLEQLNSKSVPFILSFDGSCGTKEYGEALPSYLNLRRVLVNTGRSSQATLIGRDEETVESIYLSANLAEQASQDFINIGPRPDCTEQLALALPRD